NLHEGNKEHEGGRQKTCASIASCSSFPSWRFFCAQVCRVLSFRCGNLHQPSSVNNDLAASNAGAGGSYGPNQTPQPSRENAMTQRQRIGLAGALIAIFVTGLVGYTYL